MKTVGLILKETRIRKNLTLEHIEKETRIRKKFLEAIESDDFSVMPSLSYAKGFVKNYSDYLRMDTGTVMAFFRRQSKDISRSSLLPKGVSEPLNSPLFQLTPGRFLTLIIAGLVCVFLLYFGLQYRRIQAPPTLIVDSLKGDTITTEKRVEIFGSTDPDATVTINGVNVQVQPDGKFYEQVENVKNITTITIVATSRYGKRTIVTKSLQYKSP